jgi:transcriptional regulator with XRE-family HTH domain
MLVRMPHHSDLSAFLRNRRAALTPAEVGLPAGGRRRTPGLRRQEVADLATMSVTYYERLEQARAPHPPVTVLAAVARALRLDPQERDYFYALAGQAAPVAPAPPGYTDPVLTAAMNSVGPLTSAIITDHLGTARAQNPLSIDLIGDLVHAPGHDSNLIWRWFTMPEWRTRHWLSRNEEGSGASIVAYLRVAVAQYAPDPDGTKLVAALLVVSAEFAELWNDYDVAAVYCSSSTVPHARTGPLSLDCGVVLSPLSSHRLMLFQPTSGTPAAERLSALSF